jgi:hypothetical protein
MINPAKRIILHGLNRAGYRLLKGLPGTRRLPTCCAPLLDSTSSSTCSFRRVAPGKPRLSDFLGRSRCSANGCASSPAWWRPRARAERLSGCGTSAIGDHRGDSAIRQQRSDAVVSGRIDRERYLAANPEIEAEIDALYQGRRCRTASPMLLPEHPSRARQRRQRARSKCNDDE